MIYIDKCEINVTRHCNNSCAACNHGSPLAAPYFMDPEVLRRDLAALKPFLRIGFLCLQGGEPLIHPRIADLMRVQRESGIADQYGMLSNGKLVSRMSEEVYQEAARSTVAGKPFELRVSLYANLDADTLTEPIRKAARLGFEIRVGPTPIFWKLFHEQADGGKNAWDWCKCKTCYTIHEGQFYHCPLACFFPTQFFDQPASPDGLPLAGVTEKILAGFLARPTPLWTCGRCAGGAVWGVLWHETRDRETWIKEATVLPHER